VKGVVTFDFDDTLFSSSEEKMGLLWAASEILTPIQKVHDLLWEKHHEGYIIDIITARNSWDLPEVKQYIEAYKLPIRHVEATAGRPKSPILKMTKSVLHVDDMVAVAIDCKMNNIPVLLVDDGRHKNNSTAEEFDRIFIDRNF
jgi:FMN phosphatase YigB (HAD superfamily)